VAQVCARAEEFEAREVEILIITFGEVTLARRWMEETCVGYSILLDPEREAYTAYGLERSWIRSWNLRTFFTYLRLFLSGRKWRGVQGDSAQLGGDFIIDADGILRLTYRSRDPTDRPPVETLLGALEPQA
jgi:peroxiredoxin